MLSTMCKALLEIWQGLNALPTNLSVKRLPNSSPREDKCTCTGKSSADDRPNVGQRKATEKEAVSWEGKLVTTESSPSGRGDPRI